MGMVIKFRKEDAILGSSVLSPWRQAAGSHCLPSLHSRVVNTYVQHGPKPAQVCCVSVPS
jgi:hypothetical protein